jgi:hypothetical protein
MLESLNLAVYDDSTCIVLNSRQKTWRALDILFKSRHENRLLQLRFVVGFVSPSLQLFE